MLLRQRDYRPVWVALAVAAAVAGIWLRVWQLGSQILIDDEWHAIHKLLTADYADIASHFGFADYCIPLTLYFKFLTLHGGLTEWAMRWPMLLCGVALIFVAPWMLRRQASAATLAVWMGLIALSPMMTYHSRIARPYAITTLLVFVAMMAFREWRLRGDRRLRWAVLYVICAAFAAWLHLITLPFILLPFVFFGVDALRNRRWASLGGLVCLGVVTAALIAAALLPPLIGDAHSLAAKSGTGYLTPYTIYRTLLVCFGVSEPILCCVLSALCAAGAVAWFRRDRGFVFYIGTVAIGGAIAIGILRPAWEQNPVTYGRYLQPIVPFLLLFVAEGFAFAASRLADIPRALVATLALCGLVVAGPMPEYLYSPNQFMAHPYFQADYDPAHNPMRTLLPKGPVPDFYRQLAAQPPRSLTLIEAPWSLLSYYDPQEFYQAVHRQTVRIGLVGPLCGSSGYGEFGEDSGLRLRHFVHVASLLRGETHGDFLVMHRKPWPAPRKDFPDVAACLPAIEAKLGQPAYDDGDLAVFALTPKAKEIATTLH